MRHTALIALSALIFSGCQSPEKAPEKDLLGKYERPLPDGAPALWKVPASQWPDVASNFRRNPTDLVKAGKRSLAWFDNASTTNHFPKEGISHAHAKASVETMLQLLRTSRSGAAFTRAEGAKLLAQVPVICAGQPRRVQRQVALGGRPVTGTAKLVVVITSKGLVTLDRRR